MIEILTEPRQSLAFALKCYIADTLDRGYFWPSKKSCEGKILHNYNKQQAIKKPYSASNFLIYNEQFLQPSS